MGAPVPLYISLAHPTVCSLCYDMHRALDKADSEYWEGPVKEYRPVRPDPNHEHC